MRRVSAKDARLGGMSMNNLGLQFPQDVLDLKIRRYVVMRIDLPSQVVEDDEIKFLVLRKLIQISLRPKRRPSYQRNIVASLSQKFAGNERILLRATQD
jgi:hypothetical protein